MSTIPTARHWTFVIAAALALGAGTAGPAGAAEVSPDLIAKAKQEGQVVYYTDLIIDQIVRPLAATFEAKYGIKVSFTRADSQVNILRLTNEYKAGRVMADVFGLTSGLEVLIDGHIVRKFTSPNTEELPPRYRDPDHYWSSSHLFVMTPAVNTSLVPAAQRPKTYEDLLNPYWKGKMVWKPNDMSGAPGFIGNILTSMGEERGMDYLRRLSQQNITQVNAAARAVLDQVIAGEYPMSLQIFNHHAAISAQKGAPVEWLRLNPATVTPGLEALTEGSPHPNAGLLFIDYMASPEGQRIFQKASYMPARADVPALIPDLVPDDKTFSGDVITPAITQKSYDHWNDVFNKLFR